MIILFSRMFSLVQFKGKNLFAEKHTSGMKSS